MGYNLRDSFFECEKDYTKRGLQYNIRQQCDEMRKGAITISGKHCGETFVYIDTVEQKRLQSVEVKAMETSVAKKILKMNGCY